MYKKVLCLLLSLGITVASASITLAEEDIKVRLDGNIMEFDVQPQMIQDRVMVPMRFIFGALGAQVEWDGETRTIVAVKSGESGEGTIVIMQIDNPFIFINDQRVELDVAPQIIDDRTLVPIRAVADSLNADVQWLQDEKTVEIVSGQN